MEGKGGRCRVPYELMVCENYEFGRLTETFARPFSPRGDNKIPL